MGATGQVNGYRLRASLQFTCDNCQRRYSLPDDKVRGRTVKVRCKSCGHLSQVSGASAAPDVKSEPAADSPFDRDESTSVVSLDQIASLRAAARGTVAGRKSPVRQEGAAQWYAMLKGAQVGPFDTAALTAKFQSGELHARTFMWKHGMADWKRADEVSEISPLLVSSSSSREPVAPPAPVVAAPPPLTQPDDEAIREEPLFEAQFEAAAQATVRPAAPSPKRDAGLDSLFSDDDVAAASPGVAAPREEAEEDPFANVPQLPSAQPRAPGEDTQSAMLRAGVNSGQRNPAWKIALFVLALIGLPLGVLYLLSELNVVPLTVNSVNAQGQQVESSVFSGAGVSGLGDLLMGRDNKPSEPSPLEAPEIKAAPVKRAPTAGAKKEEVPKPEDPNRPSSEDLAELYEESTVGSSAPKGKVESAPSREALAGGLDEAQVTKVVGQSQPAFQGCIEAALKKNPNLRVGKITLAATVAPSGAVTWAEIDKRDVARSELGECLISRARRMVFTPFEGEETELQIPLMVTASF